MKFLWLLLLISCTEYINQPEEIYYTNSQWNIATYCSIRSVGGDSHVATFYFRIYKLDDSAIDSVFVVGDLYDNDMKTILTTQAVYVPPYFYRYESGENYTGSFESNVFQDDGRTFYYGLRVTNRWEGVGGEILTDFNTVSSD